MQWQMQDSASNAVSRLGLLALMMINNNLQLFVMKPVTLQVYLLQWQKQYIQTDSIRNILCVSHNLYFLAFATEIVEDQLGTSFAFGIYTSCQQK